MINCQINKALCLNNLMVHIKNTQGSTLKTNTVPKIYCRPDSRRWRFQLKRYWLQIRSDDYMHDNSVLEGLMMALTTSANKGISLSGTSLPEPRLSFFFSVKHHVNFTPPSLWTVLTWTYCTYTYVRYEPCKVKMLQKIKENLDTMFFLETVHATPWCKNMGEG